MDFAFDTNTRVLTSFDLHWENFQNNCIILA